MGSSWRLGYRFCATRVPGGCTPRLDWGGWTMILGSIAALERSWPAAVRGKTRVPRGFTMTRVQFGGSWLKSIPGCVNSGVNWPSVSGLIGAGALDWQKAVVAAQTKRARVIRRIAHPLSTDAQLPRRIAEPCSPLLVAQRLCRQHSRGR